MKLPPSKRILVLLAAGAEEMETVIIVDVLRRAGLDVTLAGVDGPEAVLCSRNVRIVPDHGLSDAVGPFDLVVLPGGIGGSKILGESQAVKKLLQAQELSGRFIGAICAAPTALVHAGVGRGRTVTSHPGVRRELEAFTTYSEDRVVQDGPLITSRGPGTSMEFALYLVKLLLGPEDARKIAESMLFQVDPPLTRR